MGGTASPGVDLQRSLSAFLSAELLHTLGSYGLASRQFQELRQNLGLTAAEQELDKAAEQACLCNDHLRQGLHRPAREGEERVSSRRPSPFAKDGPPRPELPNVALLERICAFYVNVENALGLYARDLESTLPDTGSPGHRLGGCLSFVHDPQRRGRSDGSAEARAAEELKLVRAKISRTGWRLVEVCDLLPGDTEQTLLQQRLLGKVDAERRFEGMLAQHAGDPEAALVRTLIQAMSEAHMWMHEAEHVRAKSFGPMLEAIPDTFSKAQEMLRYSKVLHTFVFVAARAVPWIFSEDDTERDLVIDDFERSCKMLAPTYCTWISAQISLLALHRRAFARWTEGKRDEAYRDFHKLTRLLRGLRKPSGKRGLRVPGTKTFIAGVTGMSELHIGRIYRGQHAHSMALGYFQRASTHLKRWEFDPEIGPLIRNSHWRINLLVNQGKANYELGRIKRSLLAYAEAWRAFLLLVESETHATANTEVVTEFIEWLREMVDEPTLSRTDLRDQLEPLVEQLVTLRSPIHLRLMGADLVMRLGHLLFILQLPPKERKAADLEDERWDPRSDHDQALRCIKHAASLDPTSTLTAADLLKIMHARTWMKVDDMAGEVERLDRTPLAEHWPSGSGSFEEVARITEYVLQRWLTTAPTDEAEGREKLARELIGSFLAHTDSSNVKLAQVYRYLMEGERQIRGRQSPDEYTMDFVCLRRYSSFFPFLPRPSAFRAAGGGYFVRVREPGEERPFGIAIDPGPDFIENLYRCGYALADIQMVVITHDHADHIAALDALLALMGIRGNSLGYDTFDREGRRLAIVGNESVFRRYQFFNDPHPTHRDRKTGAPDRQDAVKVLKFEEMARVGWIDSSSKGARPNKALKDAGIYLPVKSLKIEPVQSWGHQDANGYVAQGFLLSFGRETNRSSILFTGDTGMRPQPGESGHKGSGRLRAKGSKPLRDAVREADVVVAHLSSVPLRELRELAGMECADDSDPVIADYKALWERAAAQAERDGQDKGISPDERRGVEATQFLIKQVQFGFRSKPEVRDQPDYRVSPFTDTEHLRRQPARHLYLNGLLEIAALMAEEGSARSPLLLVGELREEMGTFRTQIAHRVAEAFFKDEDSPGQPWALTSDIGLRVRISRPTNQQAEVINVLCTTCDLDNDLMPNERFHPPRDVYEVCVKGEDEGVFYNCPHHNPRRDEDDLWVESVERYNVFGP